MVLSLVFGLVFFGLGCFAGAGFGAALFVVGMIGGADCFVMQDERRMARCNDESALFERECWNPSKHGIEEHDMLNWLKASRKALNAE